MKKLKLKLVKTQLRNQISQQLKKQEILIQILKHTQSMLMVTYGLSTREKYQDQLRVETSKQFTLVTEAQIDQMYTTKKAQLLGMKTVKFTQLFKKEKKQAKMKQKISLVETLQLRLDGTRMLMELGFFTMLLERN